MPSLPRRRGAAMSATEQTETLLSALLAFQADAPELREDATNPHFKSRYLSLHALMEAVRPVLTRHGLVWITKPGHSPDVGPCLGYRLAHAPTGESIEGIMPLLAKAGDPQGQGSALTYARRYSLMAVLGLVADDDDDGNRGSGRGTQRNGDSRPAVSARPPEATERTVTARQRGLINARAAEKSLTKADLAVILAAVAEHKDAFASPEAAENWYGRAMDRLPARLVDPLLQAISTAEANDAVPF